MNFDHHLKDTVTARRFAGYDGRGRPTWAAEKRIIKCKTEQHADRIMGPDGVEVLTRLKLGTHTEITEDDFIWEDGADTDDVSQATQPAQRPQGTTLGGSLWFEIYL